MSELSDIESIILDQKWKKKSNSYQNSPSQRSPARSLNTSNKKLIISTNSSQNSSLGSLDGSLRIEVLDESLKEQKNEEPGKEIKEDNKERVAELSKLAVPYRILNEVLSKLTFKKIDSAMIPAFPMRKFGKMNDQSPKFEFLKPEKYLSASRGDEVKYIKMKSGRTVSPKASTLPPLYSPKAPSLPPLYSSKVSNKH